MLSLSNKMLALHRLPSLRCVKFATTSESSINRFFFDVLLDAQLDCVILNLPYEKISLTAIVVSIGGVKVANLYTAFLVIAIQTLNKEGEYVAIIPRSWVNGSYLKGFRKWILNECLCIVGQTGVSETVGTPQTEANHDDNVGASECDTGIDWGGRSRRP